MPTGGPPLIRLFAALALILAALLPGALARAQDPAAAGPAQTTAPTFPKNASGNEAPTLKEPGGLDAAKLDLAKLQEWRRGQEAEFAATKARMDYFYWNTAMGVAIVTVFVVCFCLMHLFGRATGNFSRYFIVITAIGTTIFLMVMGYTEAQVAPAFGLLGTILGYIFGKQAGETEAKTAQDSARTAASDARTTVKQPDKAGAEAKKKDGTEEKKDTAPEGKDGTDADHKGKEAK